MKSEIPEWKKINCYICILENPNSGPEEHRDKVAKLAQLLKNAGYNTRHEQLISIEQTKAQIDTHLHNGCKLIIAAGGDGTVRSIYQCLDNKNIPIFIFPVGTENLLAREVGSPDDPQVAFDAIENFRIRKIDMVQINKTIFLSVGGVGIDSQVVNILDNSRKGHIKKMDYVWPTLKTFFTYKFPAIKITADDNLICDQPAILFLGNISRYGGGFKLFENALCDDGKIDLVIFRCSNVFQLLYLFALTVLGIVRKSKMSSRYQCSKIKIESTATLNSQIDGDPGPQLPLDIIMQPGALTLLVPANNTDGRMIK
ncbi:MAG: NAD(+)/NADH kinase [Phycisphaerae bacterium]|nr:NAD(+)/NADH kinase [Phycisphaerae bacterium]